MPNQAYRLRIRSADDLSDTLVLTSIRGGTNPYIAAPPSGDGQEVDLLTGAVRTGAYVVEVVDAVTGSDAIGTIRVVTNKLYDGIEEYLLLENGDKILLESGDPIELEQNNAEFGRPHLLSRKAYVEMSSDGGSTWSVWIAGYLTSVRQTDAIRYAFTISNSRRVEQTKQVFTWQTAAERTAFPKRGCIFGGPVIEGLGGGTTRTVDSGGWEFLYRATTGSSASPIEGDTLALKYDFGYFPPLYERKAVPGPDQTAQFWNNLLPFMQPVPTDSSASGADFAALRGEDGPIYGASDILCIVTNPATGDEWLGSLRGIDIDGQAADNNNRRTFVYKRNIFVTLYRSETSWPALPAQGTTLRVRGVTRQVSEASPLYLQAHPVDIAAALYTQANLSVNSASVTNVKALVGSTMWLTARITQAQTMADFLETALYGPFGFSARTNALGEMEFFSTRALTSTAPTETIDNASIVGDTPPTIFDLDESTVVTGFTITQVALNVATATDTPFTQRPADNVFSTTQPVEYVSGDTTTYSTRVVNYDIPGMVTDSQSFVPTFQELARGIALEGFDRFGRGAPSGEVQVLRTASVASANIGDFVYVDASYYPNKNYRIGESSVGPRVAQIVRREERPEGPVFKFVDAGPFVQPALAPTITIAASSTDARRVAAFTITNAATLINIADVSVAVEYGTGSTQPSGGITFTRYTSAQIPAGPVDLPAVTPGTRVWVRARTEQAGIFPSAWSAWADVTLTAWAAPTGVTVGTLTNQTAAVSWNLNGNTSDPIDVYVAPGSVAPSSWTKYRVNTLPPNTTSTILTGLLGSTAYIVGIAFRDMVANVAQTPITATFTTVAGTTGTCEVPAGLAVIEGVNDVTLSQGVALALWPSVGASSFVLERAPNLTSGVTDYPGTYVELAVLPPTAETYVDYLPRTGTKYWYRIKHRADGQADSAYVPQRQYAGVGFANFAGVMGIATGIPTTITRPPGNAITLTPETLYDEAGPFLKLVLVRLNYVDPQNRIVYYEYRSRERIKQTWGAWTAWSGALYPRTDLTYMQADATINNTSFIYQVEWRVYAADANGNVSFFRTGISEWPQNYGINTPIIKIQKQGFNADTQKYEVWWRYYFERGNNTLDEDGEDNTQQSFTTQVVSASVKDQFGASGTSVATNPSKTVSGWYASWDSLPTQAWTFEVQVGTSLPSEYYLQYQDTDYLDEQFVATTYGETFASVPARLPGDWLWVGDYGVVDNPSTTTASYVTSQTAKLQTALDAAASQRRVLYCGGLRIKVNGPLFLTGPGILFDSTRNDDGAGLYVLTNGASGTGYTVLTACQSYSGSPPVPVKACIVNTYDVKIQADPSLGSRPVVNGVKFFNPQISTIQNVRVRGLDGFGCNVDEVYDSVIDTISVELCGNSTTYACSISGPISGASNETHIMRIQAEECYERVIDTDVMACVIDKIHSERAVVTINPSNPAYADTWRLYGSRTHFNQGRFTATGPETATLRLEGETNVYTAYMTESGVNTVFAGGVNTGILINCPNLSNQSSITSSNTGRVMIVGGQISSLNVSNANTVHPPTLLVNGTGLGSVTIDFCGNPANVEQTVFENCRIGTLQATSTLAAATFRGCTIVDWNTTTPYYFGYCWVFENDCRIAADSTISVQDGVYFRDSKVTANVEVGGGSTIIATNTMFVGNLTQLGSPPVGSSIFDGACSCTGTVTGFDAAPGAGPAGSVKQPNNYWHRGQRMFNMIPAVGAVTSWVCTSAGAPGTWTAEQTLVSSGFLSLE